MLLIYSKGRDNAFIRLREEITKGFARSAYNPPTSGKVILTSQPPVKSIRSRIETSYAEYCHDLPLQFGLPREKPFCPYRLIYWLRELLILMDNTIKRLEKEAA